MTAGHDGREQDSTQENTQENTIGKPTRKTHRGNTQANAQEKTLRKHTGKHTGKTHRKTHRENTQGKHTGKTHRENTLGKNTTKTHRENAQENTLGKHTGKTHRENTQGKRTRLPCAVSSCAFHVPCPLASPLRVFLVLAAMLAVAFDQGTPHTACGSGRATPEPRSPGQSRYGFPYVFRCLRHIVGGRGGRGHARQLFSSSSGSFAPLILAEFPLCAPGYVVGSLYK